MPSAICAASEVTRALAAASISTSSLRPKRQKARNFGTANVTSSSTLRFAEIFDTWSSGTVEISKLSSVRYHVDLRWVGDNSSAIHAEPCAFPTAPLRRRIPPMTPEKFIIAMGTGSAIMHAMTRVTTKHLNASTELASSNVGFAQSLAWQLPLGQFRRRRDPREPPVNDPSLERAR